MTFPIKDRDGDTVMDTVEPTNTHGLTDNCYYVCAAKLSGKSTDEVVKETEEMQIGGGSDLKGIKSLFTKAGLNANVTQCGSVATVRATVLAIPGSANAFGVAFVGCLYADVIAVPVPMPSGPGQRDQRATGIVYPRRINPCTSPRSTVTPGFPPMGLSPRRWACR